MNCATKPSHPGRAGTAARLESSGTISLPVMDRTSRRMSRSRMSRWRTLSLVAVHLLIIGHIVHWVIAGKTLSPVEPSEAMYTLNEGHVNAGFIFFAVALAATLIFGRFVCGWGCHVIAYQDLCAWILRKIGIRPKPFRSRILVFAPLALALYMFVWPTLYRWWVGTPAPELTNHVLKTKFWETFPGPTIAIVTVVVCGFAAVYFLGSKGFCTYACPYGGFFAVVEKIAPGRIRVTDACEHCGHCTAACTSNVRVHEEVARYGMVVDPGCMKCMDCVSVCPNDALYFGFGRPSALAGARAPRPAPSSDPPTAVRSHSRGGHRARGGVSYDFSLGEEVLMTVIGLGGLLAFRGLYDQIPLLLAMAMAAITAYVAVKLVHLLRAANVRLQNLQLKRGGRLTGAGAAFSALAVLLLVFAAHSSAVRYSVWRGHQRLQSLQLGDEVWARVPPSGGWWDNAPAAKRQTALDAIAELERGDRIGLLSSPSALTDLVWLYLAADRTDRAEATLKRLVTLMPDQPAPYRGLAGVYRKTGRLVEAERLYRKALRVDPEFVPARRDLAAMYYGRGMEKLEKRSIEAAIGDLNKAAATQPEVALYHYNLAVATFMAGRPADALPHIREAIRLEPSDVMAQGFKTVILQELGDVRGSDTEGQTSVEP